MPANQSSRAHRQSTRILTVVTVGPHVLRTTRGNLYLPGTTQAGEAIIFWGSAGDRWNIDKVRASGPLTVRCLCREAVSRQGTRQIWVPQISPLEVLEGAVEPAEPKTSWECPPLDETVDEENGEWDEPKDIDDCASSYEEYEWRTDILDYDRDGAEIEFDAYEGNGPDESDDPDER